MSPRFLYTFFQSPDYWRQIRRTSRGGAQPNVNASMLGQLQLPVPPYRVQERFTAELESRLAETRAVAGSLHAELAAIEALPAALLREAFGEVPEHQ